MAKGRTWRQRVAALIGSGPPGVVLEDDRYAVGFRRVCIGDELQFVPGWALDRAVCRKIVAGKRYEPQTHSLVQAIFRQRTGGMVHAGTYFGDMLPAFARACPGTLWAFEPVLEHYLLARLCVQANDLQSVMLFHAGLGAAPGPARMDTGQVRHRGGGARVAAEGQLTTLLALDTLRLPGLAVIHLDLEGYELPALQGAARTIAEHRPTILVEDNEGTTAPFLAQAGYLRLGAIPGLTVWEVPERAGLTAVLLPGPPAP